LSEVLLFVDEPHIAEPKEVDIYFAKHKEDDSDTTSDVDSLLDLIDEELIEAILVE